MNIIEVVFRIAQLYTKKILFSMEKIVSMTTPTANGAVLEIGICLLFLIFPLTVRLHTRRQTHSGWVSHISGG